MKKVGQFYSTLKNCNESTILSHCLCKHDWVEKLKARNYNNYFVFVTIDKLWQFQKSENIFLQMSEMLLLTIFAIVWLYFPLQYFYACSITRKKIWIIYVFRLKVIFYWIEITIYKIFFAIEGKPEVWNCATEEYGTYCQFPFIYDGVMHHRCINLNSTAPEDVHCAATTFMDRKAKDIKKCLPDSCVIGRL